MESELLGSIWRWELSPYKDQSGPTQQMREHRDGGPRKRGLKAEGTRDRWWKRGKEGWRREREKVRDGWGSRSEGASSVSCSPFKEEPGKQIRSPLFSWGSTHTYALIHTHTQPPFNRPPPLHTNIQLTNFYTAPAADLPGPEQIHSVLKSSPLTERVETWRHNDSLCVLQFRWPHVRSRLLTVYDTKRNDVREYLPASEGCGRSQTHCTEHN